MTFYCDLEQKVTRENLSPEQFLVARYYLVLVFNGTRVEIPVTKKEYDSAVIGTIYKLVEDRK